MPNLPFVRGRNAHFGTIFSAGALLRRSAINGGITLYRTSTGFVPQEASCFRHTMPLRICSCTKPVREQLWTVQRSFLLILYRFGHFRRGGGLQQEGILDLRFLLCVTMEGA